MTAIIGVLVFLLITGNANEEKDISGQKELNKSTMEVEENKVEAKVEENIVEDHSKSIKA